LVTAPSFLFLTVLIIPENRISSLGTLRSCTSLVQLDLSSNAVCNLEDGDFWRHMSSLKVLLLHRNQVADWRSAIHIGQAPSLTYLTLHENPIASRKMYRNLIVNCCESLRGLDFHVVSDEEVIEGASFGKESRFGCLSSSLALPAPLVEGLTNPVVQSCDYGEHPGASRADTGDKNIVATVHYMCAILHRFHAASSPVIICQRFVQRILSSTAQVMAATKIQACARLWRVKWRARLDLKEVLHRTDELYLIEEALTPCQFLSILAFKRHIREYLRHRVRILMALRIERLVVRHRRRFSAVVACLERAKVKSLAVSSSNAPALTSAIAKALVVRHSTLPAKEATAQATRIVHGLSSEGYSCVHPFSRAAIPAWPDIGGDVGTDGIFILRGRGAARLGGGAHRRPSPETLAAASNKGDRGRAHHPGSIETCRHDRAPQIMGLYQTPRVRRCAIKSRGASFRCQESTERVGSSQSPTPNLLLFKPADPWMLARVFILLRQGPPRGGCVPTILEPHLRRAAASTRLQAAWRGHVLRWNLLPSLSACLVVSRGAVCIQRWWRALSGVKRRLKLLRRLWALATAVSSPTLYVEPDVYQLITGPERWEGSALCSRLGCAPEGGIMFGFHGDGSVVMVSRSCSCDGKGGKPVSNSAGKVAEACRVRHTAWGGMQTLLYGREFPHWLLPTVSRVHAPHAGHLTVLCHPGALLMEGVELRRVVWPVLAPPPAPAPCNDSREEGIAPQQAYIGGEEYERRPTEASALGIHINSSSMSQSPSSACVTAVPKQSLAPPGVSPFPTTLGRCGHTSVDLTTTHPGQEMWELRFRSTEEARARALILAVMTQEPGMRPNVPFAPLMSLEMLHRANSGRVGQAAPTLPRRADGFVWGEPIELLSASPGGGWDVGVVERPNGDGTYQVLLDNQGQERRAPEGRLRPHDCTGREKALVDLSALPSPWCRAERDNLTPSERVKMDLTQRSLPPTSDSSCRSGTQGVFVVSNSAGNTPRGENFAPRSPRGAGFGRGGTNEKALMPVVGKQTLLARGACHPSPLRPHSAAARTQAKKQAVNGWTASVDKEAAAEVVPKHGLLGAVQWVPGNRFRRDLEKLVALSAEQAQAQSDERDLEDRRQSVRLARSGERSEPSPRERLERLRAAEMALHRREVLERREHATAERASEQQGRVEAAASAREASRTRRESLQLRLDEARTERALEAVEGHRQTERMLHQMVEVRRAEGNVARERAEGRRALHTRQAVAVAENLGFAVGMSQVMRYCQRQRAAEKRAREKGGLRQQVRDRRVCKEEVRQRLLLRVEELQSQKRHDACHQRKLLTAQTKARAMMDNATLRHRLG
ncbi:unnamed protein product, partial [Discosporangium mesarthrocarpum]